MKTVWKNNTARLWNAIRRTRKSGKSLNRKQRFFIVSAGVLAGCLYFVACNTMAILNHIPMGYVSKEEHFDQVGWQDYTDYCKYQYWSSIPFQLDTRYHIVSEAEIENIIGYFDDFRGWMEVCGRLDEYDFDPVCINAGDYLLIDTKEGKPIGQNSHYRKYDCYTLYFFDRETWTLYYIHTNI